MFRFNKLNNKKTTSILPPPPTFSVVDRGGRIRIQAKELLAHPDTRNKFLEFVGVRLRKTEENK